MAVSSNIGRFGASAATKVYVAGLGLSSLFALLVRDVTEYSYSDDVFRKATTLETSCRTTTRFGTSSGLDIRGDFVACAAAKAYKLFE